MCGGSNCALVSQGKTEEIFGRFGNEEVGIPEDRI